MHEGLRPASATGRPQAKKVRQVIDVDVSRLIEQHQSPAVPTQQILGKTILGEAFVPGRLLIELLVLADCKKRDADALGHEPAKLGFAGARRAIGEDVDSGSPLRNRGGQPRRSS